jgi:hypothetical protein
MSIKIKEDNIEQFQSYQLKISKESTLKFGRVCHAVYRATKRLFLEKRKEEEESIAESTKRKEISDDGDNPKKEYKKTKN